jgi:hypothetical protein
LDPDSKAATLSVGTRIEFALGCLSHEHGLAVAHTLQSSQWKPLWKKMRALAAPEFSENFADEWAFADDRPGDWRQRLWENAMLCQGLEGLQMLLPHLRSS